MEKLHNTTTSVGVDKRVKEMIDNAIFSYYARRALRNDSCGTMAHDLLLKTCSERKEVGLNRVEIDVHFYPDNAPPKEVVPLLSLMSDKEPVTPLQADSIMAARLGVKMQADKAYSLRRILDLGLAERRGRNGGYILNGCGVAVQAILSAAHPLGIDLLHYLHFTPFAGLQAAGARAVEQYGKTRKYLWTYRRCCESLWRTGGVVPNVQLAAQLQMEMREEFPWVDFSEFAGGRMRAGGRLNAVGVGAVVTWLRALEPSPIPEDRRDKRLIPREVDRVELALLALDDVYRARGYAYGDPVIMDEALLRQAAGVFFLDLECCARLMQLAARLFPRRLTMRGTLEGAMLVVHGPYTVEDVAAGLR